MEEVTNVTATMIFFIIGCFALVLAFVSFVFGTLTEVFDGMFDWIGDHLPIDHDHDIGFSKFTNAGAVLGFVAGFGFTGAFAMAQYDVSPLAGSLLGILGGIILGGFMGAIWAGLKKSEGTTSYISEELVGQKGVVDERIPAHSRGRVECLINNSRAWRTAQSENGEDIPKGTTVRVTRVIGETLYVIPDSGSAT